MTNTINAQDRVPIILVVDDDDLNQTMLRGMLEDSYQIRTAGNGETALEMARQEPQPDLILLDVLMPEMDGYEVCRQLKLDVRTRYIPVIFVTAVNDEESEYHGLQLGAVDYITKPINPSLTRLRVQKNIDAKFNQERLRLSAKVIESASEGVLITNDHFEIIDLNQSVVDITGYAREEILGRNPNMFKSGRQDAEFYHSMWRDLQRSGSWSGEIWNRKKNGEVYPEHLSINILFDERGEISNYVAIFADITRAKQHEKELQYAAFYDALTGIPNRLLLADRMRQAMARAKREQGLLCVCYFDLDGFKKVNDSLGHDAGDKVLVEVAQRVQKMIRDEDTIARLGGDEFVILYEGFSKLSDCESSLARLLKCIGDPMKINGHTVQIGASIGVTYAPLDDAEPDTLLRHADQAMYVAKQNGKNRFCVYQGEGNLTCR